MSLRVAVLRAGLLGFSLGIALCFAEAGVRLLRPQQLIVVRPDIWQPLDGIGWAKVPGVDTEINTGEGPVRLHTDRYGFRVGSAGRQEAAIDVLLVGDSFMEALQVEYEQSLAGLLEHELAKRLDGSVAVWNTSVSGWGPSHYLIQTRRMLAERDFDLVLVSLYLGNDAEPERLDHVPPRPFVKTHELRIPRSLRWKEIVDAIGRPINDHLERRSQLFQLLKVQLRSLLIRAGLSPRYFPVELVDSPHMRAAWDGTADTLRQLIDTAEARGTPVRTIVLPSHYQIDEQALEGYLFGFDARRSEVDVDRPNRELAAAAREHGVPLMDVTPQLRHAQSEGERMHGRVDTHLSARGHEIVAAEIAPELARAIEEKRAAAASEGAEPSRPR